MSFLTAINESINMQITYPLRSSNLIDIARSFREVIIINVLNQNIPIHI